MRPIVKYPADAGKPSGRRFDPEFRIHQDGFPCVPPDLEVGAGVSGVIKVPPLAALLDLLHLSPALHICFARASEHVPEYSQMLGNCTGEFLVRRGGEVERAAAGSLGSQEFKELGLIG